MANEYVRFTARPELHDPAMVCAIRGWNDGGEAASIAARYLAEQWEAEPFGYLDPEEFYDFQVTRPTVHLEEGVSRVVEWPRGEFSAASPQGRGVVFFTAAEPNVRWRTFTSAVLDAARDLGAGVLVTLGAFLTDVPHSRPVPVVGSARDEGEAAGLGLRRSQYEGPTGIVGVLHDSANRAGLASVSLWGAVPHYLPATSNPKAALALVQRATALLGVSAETDELARAADEWEAGVSQFVNENDELAEYVRRLEANADEGDVEIRVGEAEVPSGDAIAAELERYLQERTGGEGDDGDGR
ncbi:MAG TPA: PAC2 family protein [Actinomycetota bacterium]|jgi:predicted ATP-grasp superfamily ATP-dependent carboligase